jgi:hypothetical protein
MQTAVALGPLVYLVRMPAWQARKSGKSITARFVSLCLPFSLASAGLSYFTNSISLGPPNFGEQRFERAVEDENRVPTLCRIGLNPVPSFTPAALVGAK